MATITAANYEQNKPSPASLSAEQRTIYDLLEEYAGIGDSALNVYNDSDDKAGFDLFFAGLSNGGPAPKKSPANGKAAGRPHAYQVGQRIMRLKDKLVGTITELTRGGVMTFTAGMDLNGPAYYVKWDNRPGTDLEFEAELTDQIVVARKRRKATGTTPKGRGGKALKRPTITVVPAAGSRLTKPTPYIAKHGYVVFYKGRKHEVYADTSHAAQKKGAAFFNVKPNKTYEVRAELAEIDPLLAAWEAKLDAYEAQQAELKAKRRKPTGTTPWGRHGVPLRKAKTPMKPSKVFVTDLEMDCVDENRHGDRECVVTALTSELDRLTFSFAEVEDENSSRKGDSLHDQLKAAGYKHYIYAVASNDDDVNDAPLVDGRGRGSVMANHYVGLYSEQVVKFYEANLAKYERYLELRKESNQKKAARPRKPLETPPSKRTTDSWMKNYGTTDEQEARIAAGVASDKEAATYRKLRAVADGGIIEKDGSVTERPKSAPVRSLAQFKRDIKVGQRLRIYNYIKPELSRDTVVTVAQSNAFAVLAADHEKRTGSDKDSWTQYPPARLWSPATSTIFNEKGKMLKIEFLSDKPAAKSRSTKAFPKRGLPKGKASIAARKKTRSADIAKNGAYFEDDNAPAEGFKYTPADQHPPVEKVKQPRTRKPAAAGKVTGPQPGDQIAAGTVLTAERKKVPQGHKMEYRYVYTVRLKDGSVSEELWFRKPANIIPWADEQPKRNEKVAKEPKSAKAKKEKPADTRTGVDHFDNELVFFRAFVRLTEKPVTLKQVQSLHRRLESAVVSRKIRKTSTNAGLMTDITKAVAHCYGQMVEQNIGTVDKLNFNSVIVKDARTIAEGHKISDAVNLLSSFIRLQGTRPESATVAKLVRALEAEHKGHPDSNYSSSIQLALALLRDWKPGNPVKVSAQALNGLQGLAGLGCACEAAKKAGR